MKLRVLRCDDVKNFIQFGNLECARNAYEIVMRIGPERRIS